MSALPQKAMLLAAGLGTRMRPLTNDTPKPLIPVNGRTLADRVLDWMQNAGITDVVVNTHYIAPKLEAHLARRSAPRITISPEYDLLLETGGGIKKALPHLGDAPFFSANSDTLCIDGATPAPHRLHASWNDAKMDALLLLHKVEDAVGYEGRGDFFLNDDGTLRRRAKDEAAPYVFTGVQLLHPRLFAGSPVGAFSMNVLYDRGRREDGTLPRISGIVHDGSWLHVGDPEGLRLAEAWLTARGKA